MSSSAPFRRGRFDALPERPRVPHAYFETEALTVPLRADGWPAMDAHVRRHGAGPPLLLVHGLMTSSYSFRYVLDALGAQYTCYVPDLPGAGDTPPIEGDYGPRSIARWLGALIDALDIRSGRVIGNSMGGYLAMRLALDDPGAMGRLVNLHSPGVPLARLVALKAALSLPLAERALSWMVRRDPERWTHANVHYYDESLKSREEAAEYARPLRTEAGRRAFSRYLRDTLAPGPMRAFVAELARRRDAGEGFPIPLQLVYARQDPMVPPSVGEALGALVPDAELVWLDAASHFAHVDAPDLFIRSTQAFLSAS